MRKKLIIFDFDGTLADTEECIVRTFQKTLTTLQLPMKSRGKIKATIGLPLDECFKVLTGVDRQEWVDECTSTYRSLFCGLQRDTIKLFPDVKEVLELLRKNGMMCSIATSRGGQSLDELCCMLGINELFQLKMCNNDVTEKKPAPEMVLKTIWHFGLKADDVLVVGDTIFDIMMGNNAGCMTCGVTWGNQSREQLETVHPTYIIDNMSELYSKLCD